MASATATITDPASTASISPATSAPAAAAESSPAAAAAPTPKPSYGSVCLTLDNVLIPPAKLNPSPSFIDGLDGDTETFLRVAGCELIQTSGILLKLPQTAMATGQVLFQRFYYSKSFVRQPMETTAMACIYLASKIEEAPRRIRDVINVFHHIRRFRAGKVLQTLVLDQAYIRLKSDVTLAERRVLKELGFCVHVKHPHKIIVIYLQQLGYYNNQSFVQMSWNFMNDALRTTVFVRFTPEAIACACIFLSARKLKILLPNCPAWYEVFDVSDGEVVEIASEIMELYQRPPIDYEILEKKVEVLAKAYQEIRQKGKTNIELLSNPDGEKSKDLDGGSATENQSPTTKSSTTNNENPKSDQPNLNGTKEPTTQEKETNPSSKKPQHDDSKSKTKHSPIIFRTDGEQSPPSRNSRHKKRNSKKSKYSSGSRSRSRSKSPKRSSKKYNYREQDLVEPQVYQSRKHHKNHHKKKSHHNRYPSSSRSRSRSRERSSYKPIPSRKFYRDERDGRGRDRSRSPIGSYSSYSSTTGIGKRKY